MNVWVVLSAGVGGGLAATLAVASLTAGPRVTAAAGSLARHRVVGPGALAGTLLGVALVADALTVSLASALSVGRGTELLAGLLLASLALAAYAHLCLFAAVDGYLTLDVPPPDAVGPFSRFRRFERRYAAWSYYIHREHWPVQAAFGALVLLLPATVFVVGFVGPLPGDPDAGVLSAAALAAGTYAIVVTAATSRVGVLPESVRDRVDASLDGTGGE